MSWIDVFRLNRKAAPPTAGAAKERLQIVLAHERISRTGEDFLPKLQKDLLEVISKYVAIDAKAVQVSLDRGGDMSTLAIEVELPGPKPGERKVSGPTPAA